MGPSECNDNQGKNLLLEKKLDKNKKQKGTKSPNIINKRKHANNYLFGTSKEIVSLVINLEYDDMKQNPKTGIVGFIALILTLQKIVCRLPFAILPSTIFFQPPKCLLSSYNQLLKSKKLL